MSDLEITARQHPIYYCHHCMKLRRVTKTYYKEKDKPHRILIEIVCNTCGKLINRKEY
jgi:hypothetical protein